MKQVRVLVSETHDPWFNLATEDWIFREMDPATEVLFLWRNDKTVVIGRYQNPWEECNLKAMEDAGVKLARRQSGGGAVYQDLGNTCFTFLTSRASYDKNSNSTIITSALEQFGIHAEISGRNDILVEGKKVSGSAYKLTADRAFHHGTLLINADLTSISNYLTPHKKKLESKGIASVKSRVANLADFVPNLDHQKVCEKIIEQFFKAKGASCTVETLDHQQLQEISGLKEYFEHLADWKWRFGSTPDFTHRLQHHFPWGSMDMHIDTSKGLIREVAIFSDSLKPEMIETIIQKLPGTPYGAQEIYSALKKFGKNLPDSKDELEGLASWIKGEVAR